MCRKLVILLVFIVLIASFQNGSAQSPSLQQSIDTVVTQVKPALVRIYVVSTEYWEGREMKERSSGSGVIISPEGYVITNHHVVGHATRLICTLSNREEVEAELIGTDPLTDIAIIKLLPTDGRTFPIAEFGDSTAVRVGDTVMAMGSPMALSQSVTLGIVSNTELVMPRRMGFGDFTLDGEDVGSLVRWIAHDAFIYGGNSGGPLIDMHGKIIGINEISIALSGAIPGNLAKKVADSLIESGEVKRSWLGFTVQPLLKHSAVKQGALITGTIADSPASQAGIESGDILTELNGAPVHVRFDEDMPALNAMMADLAIDTALSLKVIRKGVEKTIEITPVLRENRRLRETELMEWGVTARDISFMMAKELKRPDQNGVFVSSLRPGGPAGDAKPGLMRGDIITQVGDTAIHSIKDLRDATKKIVEDQSDPVAVLTTVERKLDTMITVVKVGVSDLKDPALEVKKAWLPVETQVLTRDLAEAMNKPERKGFRITRVYVDSTAAKAGLKEGDIIFAVDEEPLTADATEHYEELPALIRNYRAGTTVTLDVERGNEAMKIPVELILSPKLYREMRKYRNDIFQFTVRDVTFFDEANQQWEEKQNGVMVDEINSGGWADIGMLRNNDLIQEVDGVAITDVDVLKNTMEAIEKKEPTSIVIKVLRGIYTVYIELEPQWDNQ
jgi:serine protease Do